MSMSNDEQFSSPSEDLFSWATPDSELNKDAPKRKCDGDSGYMSMILSPGSACKSGGRSVSLTTPETGGDGRRCYQRGQELQAITPISCGVVMTKTRLGLGTSRQDSSSLSLTSTPDETDSFIDFSEPSLYSEPMDVSIIRSTSQLDMILEETPASGSRPHHKPPLDLSMELNSFHSDPITPLRSFNTPCDRLFKTPSSFKSHSSSPRKKKIFIKKKQARPGAYVGCDQIDFFAHLGVRANFLNIASKIIDMLSDEDLSNVTMVSKTWRNLLLSNTRAKERWQRYVAERRCSKENLPRIGGSSKKKTSFSPELSFNRNQSPGLRLRQPSSPPVSPSKIRFHLFQKEARKLKEDEKLAECPRCSLPSTVSPATRLGRCTRAGCGLEFCSSCRSPYHANRPCSTSTPSSPQRPLRRISAKESKRLLRRL